MNIKKTFVFIIPFVIFILLWVFILQLLLHFKQKVKSNDLVNFKVADIYLSSKNSTLYYSFIPDGSGIIYIEDVKKEDRFVSERYLFYYLDFKSRRQEKIHEVVFHEDFLGDKPFVYWLDNQFSLLGAQLYLGLCGQENLSATLLFDLQTKEKKFVHCVNRSRTGDRETYFSNFLQFYTYYSHNINFYKIFKLQYSSAYSDISYLFFSHNSPIYLLGNYFRDSVYLEEKFSYDELDKQSLDILVNKDIETAEYPAIYNRRIYSRDRKYYFILKNVDCFTWDCYQKQYLEVYDSDNKRFKKLFLGEIYPRSERPKFTGYVDFWTYDNKIVFIKPSATTISAFGVYLIDPRN